MAQLAPGDRFPALEVETAAGERELAERWRERPLVVVFMRHFGCAFCREHLARLSRAYAEIGAAGGDVVVMAHYSESSADNPSVEDVLAAVGQATADSASPGR